MKVYIAYGSNLGESIATFEKAFVAIEQDIGPITSRSTTIASPPLPIPDRPDMTQPEFLNGVIEVESGLAPQAILSTLLSIEESLGRVRKEDTIRWGPRTIDLDIIAIDQLTLRTKTLTIPHPEMEKRDFVLIPLAEIAPTWIHPVLHKNCEELLKELIKGDDAIDSLRG